MKKIPLTEAICDTRTYGKTKQTRAGYKDPNGQTFLPPLKNVVDWERKMEGKGYYFMKYGKAE